MGGGRTNEFLEGSSAFHGPLRHLHFISSHFISSSVAQCYLSPDPTRPRDWPAASSSSLRTYVPSHPIIHLLGDTYMMSAWFTILWTLFSADNLCHKDHASLVKAPIMMQTSHLGAPLHDLAPLPHSPLLSSLTPFQAREKENNKRAAALCERARWGFQPMR